MCLLLVILVGVLLLCIAKYGLKRCVSKVECTSCKMKLPPRGVLRIRMNTDTRELVSFHGTYLNPWGRGSEAPPIEGCQAMRSDR